MAAGGSLGRIRTAGQRAAMVVAMAALAGCGLQHGSAASTTTDSHTPAATQSPASSAAQGSPAWVKKLGAGVVVHVPATTMAGHNSPGAALQGIANALKAGRPVRVCRYYPPATQAPCRSRFAGVPASSMGTMKNFALGYVAVRGRKALVGSTGTSCVPTQQPACASNANPAAILDSGKSFSALWTESVAAANSPVNMYSLVPCIRIGGRWYVFVTPPSGG
jgi:hypothetical protein